MAKATFYSCGLSGGGGIANAALLVEGRLAALLRADPVGTS